MATNTLVASLAASLAEPLAEQLELKEPTQWTPSMEVK